MLKFYSTRLAPLFFFKKVQYEYRSCKLYHWYNCTHFSIRRMYAWSEYSGVVAPERKIKIPIPDIHVSYFYAGEIIQS